MAKRCTRCGNFLMDDERFCTRCGENVSVIPTVVPDAPEAPNGQAYNNGGYTANHAQTGVPGNRPYTYTQPAQLHEEMTIGKWLLTIILTTFFGIISIVALLIWGFSSDGPESRRNYCKAMLIVKLVTIVLGIIIGIIWLCVFAAYSDDIIRFFEDNYPELQSGLEQFAESAAVQILHI